MTGRLVDMAFTLGGKQRVTLEINGDFREIWDKLHQEPVLDVEIKKHREKRSLSAIHFNRPHPVPVYVKVVGLSTSGDFPHDGVDQLRAAIVAYIGDNESGGVSIGETLYHQRLPAVLYKVPGVLDFDVLIGTDAENLQADNIPVDSRSKVVTDDGMVTIDA